MRSRSTTAGVVMAGSALLALVVGAVANAQGSPATGDDAQPPAPLDLGTAEQATVRLVLLDTVVVDRQGRTVPGLAADDFEVLAWGDPVAVDTFDVNCSGASAEPAAARRTAAPAPAGGRRIVLAFDYLHLNQFLREESLVAAARLVRDGSAGEDEIMLVALDGGVRVEQPFTADYDAVLRSLRRMRYDISLWNGNFAHLNEHGFIGGMTGLFDVLGTVPGPKAVVLFSGMKDVPLDAQFEQLAAVASTSRCSLYTVDPRGQYDPRFELGQQPGIVPGAG